MNGNVRAVETLKQRLENGEDVDLLSESDSCTVASLVKQYLRDLPGGLIDSTVQRALIHHYQGKRNCFLFVSTPTCCLNVLVFFSNTYMLNCFKF